MLRPALRALVRGVPEERAAAPDPVGVPDLAGQGLRLRRMAPFWSEESATAPPLRTPAVEPRPSLTAVRPGPRPAGPWPAGPWSNASSRRWTPSGARLRPGLWPRPSSPRNAGSRTRRWPSGAPERSEAGSRVLCGQGRRAAAGSVAASGLVPGGLSSMLGLRRRRRRGRDAVAH